MHPELIIEMEDGGIMEIELYPDKAPVTVDNFIALAEEGYFDETSFHRVVKDFVIQGGSKNDTCCEDFPGFAIKGEFKENGCDTGLLHKRGTLSMARDPEPDTAATQFFICHKDTPRLDGKYAAFGDMVRGFDVLDRIALTPTDTPEKENRPFERQTIKRMTVKRQGYIPKSPQRLPGNIEK